MSAPAFIADCHLGKVAKYLRMMGYDTLYFPSIGDDELIEKAKQQKRIILTRDRLLSERKDAPALLLASKETAEQLKEIVRFFEFPSEQKLPVRCLICNASLQKIDKTAVAERVPKKIVRFFDYFEQCPECGRIYWHGDHYKRMRRYIDSLFD